MRSILRAGIVLCAMAPVGFASATAAEFFPLGADAVAVSPDGTTVLTTSSIWTLAGGHMAFTAAPEVYPRDISNNGLIAGLWCGPNTVSCYEAFWTPVGGPMHGLGAFDNQASDASAITPDGSVVVGSASSSTGTQSFRWTSATGLVGLGNVTPGTTSNDTAFGVSADGSVIVGQFASDLGSEAFRWTAATGMVGLGDLPGGEVSSSASDVSADGTVIVGSGESALGTEAFRWTQASGMVGLGDIHPAPFHTEATAISSDGNTVYGASSAPDVNQDAWVWTEEAGIRKLQDVFVNELGLGAQLAGWRLWSVDDVSDDGLVLVGNGRNPEGQLEGFVLVIPEPSAAALVIAALMPMFWWMQSSKLKRTAGATKGR